MVVQELRPHQMLISDEVFDHLGLGRAILDEPVHHAGSVRLQREGSFIVLASVSEVLNLTALFDLLRCEVFDHQIVMELELALHQALDEWIC